MDPMFVLIFVGYFLFTWAGYAMGVVRAAEPTEHEMFERLVRVRAARKVEAMTRQSLECDVEFEASRKAARA
jgi:hypothetical protein